MQPVRVLYVGLKYDAGDPRRGPCYEYENFLPALARLPNAHVVSFAFDVEMRQAGRAAMNIALLRTAEALQPHLVFFVLLNDDILPGTIMRISRLPGTQTLNWFGDDHWRFQPFSRRWAPYFTRVITTDATSLERYHRCGFHHVILSQWGFNPLPDPQGQSRYQYDVSFVGRAHSHRRAFITSLQRAGISVHCFGRGWANGSLPEDDRIRVIRESRINLNFTESWMTVGLRPLAKSFINRRADGSYRPHAPGVIADHLHVLSTPVRHQIKGRNFEIPGAGGFILTDNAIDLHTYFVPDEEIGTFTDARDLITKVRYYLSHDDEREKISTRGHLRALREHTYEMRFLKIFRECGIMLPDDVETTGSGTPEEERSRTAAPVLSESHPCMPRVSVIFPVKDEARFIETCLDAFLHQSYPSDRIEIVIADDSADGTREILNRYARQHPGWLIVCDNPGGSIPEGYTRALERSTGEIVCCFIGHAVPAPDYLEKVVVALHNPGCDMVGGSVDPIPSNHTRSARGIAAAMRNPMTLGPNAMTRRTPGTTSSTHWMAVKRQWVDRCGAFDPECTRLEDCDWYERMLEAGATARFDPAIRSTYYARETYGKQFRVQVANAWYRLRLFSRTGRGLRVRHLIPLAVLGIGTLLGFALFPWQGAITAALIAYGTLVIFSTGRIRGMEPSVFLHACTATVVVHCGHVLGMGAGVVVFGWPTFVRLAHAAMNTIRRGSGTEKLVMNMTLEEKP